MTTTTKTKGSTPGKTKISKPAKPVKSGKISQAGTNGGGAPAGGTVLPNQTVWEDTVIIAFGDLQWNRWREAVQKARGAKRSALLEDGAHGRVGKRFASVSAMSA